MRTSTRIRLLLVALSVSLISTVATAATLRVGPGQPYTSPCQALAIASHGDTIEISASGTYGCESSCAIHQNNLTLRGVDGRPQINVSSCGALSESKAVWVIKGENTVVENIEFTGAKVPDRNGAGIRQEGKNLTVRSCYFHHNENGILAGDNAGSNIVIENSEFGFNGNDAGSSHNLYINHVASLTFRFNYSHDSRVGHLLKTRAAENHILYNRLTSESGNGSYELDVPNGGRTFVIGNVIQQGANSQNSGVLAYQMEGAGPLNPSQELFVINNTFVNERASGTFILIGNSVATPALIQNNIFSGPGTLTTQGAARLISNFTGDPRFVDRASFNYRLQRDSPCIDTGTAPGDGLTPKYEYVHPTSAAPRQVVSTLDIGAYEYGSTPTEAGWAQTSPMLQGHMSHTATLLPSGKVLVAGSWGSSFAELYDPETEAWTATGSMNVPRVDHTATLLPSGQVLVVGGSPGYTAHNTAELYDPVTGTWTYTGAMRVARFGHTATLLPSGKVLVVGGYNNDIGNVLLVEQYDPETRSWTSLGQPTFIYLVDHTATLLPSGKVLVTGGSWRDPIAQLYDPATNTWALVADMSQPRMGHTATLLPSGKVLVAGGRGAEVFDPGTGRWTPAGSILSWSSHTATLLPSGKVLVAGGEHDYTDIIESQLYDPVTGSWSSAGNMSVPRKAHTATLLRSGEVLVAGGDFARSPRFSAELYTPAP
jgi:N-acetylneuraminic acid mutarotase